MVSVSIRELAQGFIHLFYPRLCEGCTKPLLATEQVLCLGCELQLPHTNYHKIDENETALRFAGRMPFERATSLGYFTNDGLLQHLLHRLKYNGRREVGSYLGKILGHYIREANWNTPIDLIVPVPLHKKKQAARGYNQSLLIAEGIGLALGAPATDLVLQRTRDTESQTKKTRAERVKNMEEAFRVRANTDLTRKHILLCDDVLTTGATLEACALALLAYDNSLKISIATIGIAIS